jgi:hypothetical protein
VTKNLLSGAPPSFRRHVKTMVPAAFAQSVTTRPHWARVVAYDPFSLCVIHNEGLYPSSGDINRLMMMIMNTRFLVHNINTYHSCFVMTAGWSSGLRPRLQNQRSRVRIPVVGRGFCDEQLHLLTSHGCLYILLSI